MAQSQSSEVLYLLGRPQLSEDLGFLSAQASFGEPVDLRAVAEAWRAANDVVVRLQREEAGCADDPPLGALDPAVFEVRDRLLADVAFRNTMAVIPLDVKMVDLDRLIVPQKHLDLTKALRLADGIPPEPDARALFDLCMPFERMREEVRCLRTSNDSFVFASTSHDLRFLDVMLLDSASVHGHAAPGVVSNALGIMVGYSLNCLTAMHIQNRLILINGTHRAAALRMAGIRHAPCVIQKITRPEERMLVGSREVNRNPGEFLNIPRPAMLKDFLDPRLHTTVRMSNRVRQVKVTFSVEALDAPVVQ